MGYWLKFPKFCNCSKKLHMQVYMLSHSTNLPTHVAMKYGGSSMADKWQKRCFLLSLTMNYGLLLEVAKIL